MKQKKAYLFSSLFLITLLAMIIIFRSILGDNILNPLLVALRAAWQMITSVDQSIYWSGLIITCTILAIRIIPKKKSELTSSAYRYNYKPPNPYQYWQNAFKDSSLGPNEKEYLRENLQALYESLVTSQSYTDTLPEKPILPPSAKYYLLSQDRDKKTISYLFPRWWRRLAGSYFYKDNSSIDELLTWMERQLEINNGD